MHIPQYVIRETFMFSSYHLSRCRNSQPIQKWTESAISNTEKNHEGVTSKLILKASNSMIHTAQSGNENYIKSRLPER